MKNKLLNGENCEMNERNSLMPIYDHSPATQSILRCAPCVFHYLRKGKVEGSIYEYEMRFICECPEECTWEDSKFKRWYSSTQRIAE